MGNPLLRKNRWFRPRFVCTLLVGVVIGGVAYFMMAKNSGVFLAEPSFEEAFPNGLLSDELRFDRLLLEKSKRKLTAFSQGIPMRVYYVALSDASEGHKQFQGDHKTPEGNYLINDKNPNSAFYKNLGISYPNKADREFAKKYNKDPGGDIKIHGLSPSFSKVDKLHRLKDWTQGCVAVTNLEMEELYTRTPVGTPIEILP